MAFTNRASVRLILIFFYFLVSGPAFSQASDPSDKLEILLVITVGLLLLVSMVMLSVVVYTSKMLKRIMDLERKKKAELEGEESEPFENFWQHLSRSLTRSTPVAKEATILMDHNYDGIRELDNHLPPWWKTLFYITIIWAAIYLLVYHVFDVFPLSGEEYDREMAQIEAERKAARALVAESLDENTVEFSDSPEILTSGAAVFKTHCVVCHAEDGGGGVGPNLTDDYWLHGGSINNIFWVIKYGVPAKGMIPWQNQLTATNIRDVASYIKSLKGSTPANPKAPQGDLYDETMVVENIESAPDTRPTIREVGDSLDKIQIGRGLFSGSVKMINGGPGCITCHHVTEDILPKGALIAPDLTNVYTRLDEQTIMKYATKPYHAVMQAAYQDMPVLEEEVTYLISFFKYVGTSTTFQQKRDQRAASFLNRIKKK